MPANCDTGGLSNGGTEAVNLLIEKARRLAHSYRNFTTHSARSSPPAEDALPPTPPSRDLTMLISEEPSSPGQDQSNGCIGLSPSGQAAPG